MALTLTKFAVKRPTIQEWIEFDLLKTTWGIQALLIAS